MNQSTSNQVFQTTATSTVEPLLYRMPDVLRMTGLGKTKIYEMMQAGQFPRPLKLGPRAIGWRPQDLKDWVNSLEQQAPR